MMMLVHVAVRFTDTVEREELQTLLKGVEALRGLGVLCSVPRKLNQHI